MDRPSCRAFVRTSLKAVVKSITGISKNNLTFYKHQQRFGDGSCLLFFLDFMFVSFFLSAILVIPVSPCTALKQPILSVFGPNEMLPSFVLTTIHPSMRFIFILLFLQAVTVLFLSFCTLEGHSMEIFRWNYSPLQEKGFCSTFVGLSLHNFIVNCIYLKRSNKKTSTYIFMTFLFLSMNCFFRNTIKCIYVGIAYSISSKSFR